MTTPQPYLPKEIVPQDELRSWREGLKKAESTSCPAEVRDFIAAVAAGLPAFSRIGQEYTMITGFELKLAGMKEYNGEIILDTVGYELPVPKMVAVDHYNAMHRMYNKRGKQGLVDYCTKHVEPAALHRLLDILNVAVFKEEHPEFTRMMNEIKKVA
ncbi:MAG TPA: hypothetical protein VK658_23200 [Chryseolinea sp.]|nr:hypothetical protein [Chryseolinea sp.]